MISQPGKYLFGLGVRRRLVAATVAGLLGMALATSSRGAVPHSSARTAPTALAVGAGCPTGSVAEQPRSQTAQPPRCELPGAPEGLRAQAQADSARWLHDAAPGRSVDAAAVQQAWLQRDAIIRSSAAAAGASAGTWAPVGLDALHADDPSYDPTKNGWGSVSGRLTSFAYVPGQFGHVFASSVNGGVWASSDAGGSWRSVGDTLPTQAVGAIGYTPFGGGTLIAATGDNATGRYSVFGRGVYRSTDLGATWTRSPGVPNTANGYRVAVDPSNPATVYVATSQGLWRSINGGAAFVNVVLPTGCTDYNQQACFFANMVSDVVVRSAEAGGTGGGKVLAAVGYRYGAHRTLFNPDGTAGAVVMGPKDGIYTSDNGLPGTFVFHDSAASSNGFLSTPDVGRVALGIAHGQDQNHDLVYALVEDASKAQGCVQEVDIQTCQFPDATLQGALQPSVLDGAYVSPDFGATWVKIMDAQQLRLPGNNSSLTAVLPATGYGPGVQSWYNEWIEPDPTFTDPVSRAPMRLLFGLEEVWENQLPIPQNGLPAINGKALEQWKSIGRYWNNCTGLIVDPTNIPCTGTPPIPGTTTHPDQHAAMMVPDPAGGVLLFAGNDGGVYSQHANGLTSDFSQLKWGTGKNSGLHTIQAYDAEIARDGTVVAGEQDNGSLKIAPDGRQDMIYGGDGFFVGIDPNNSQNILEEYVGGRVSVSQDGGHTFGSKAPTLTNAQFSTPIQQDPLKPAHFLIAGQEIMETN
ncbi:MAG: glycoside hydrolase, partial [Candidatus Dormibacteraeota bacterium]|nr:glycoside hydrolase [Candidatus Dormibacteraeota bacterium]